MEQSSKQTIAVIIPAYNQAAYIREALDSVFSQTRLPDQVIAINDGSTDETATVLEELQKQYPNIVIISQENAGVCLACAAALEQVSTSLVLRLDGDDSLPPEYIAELEKALLGQPDEVAFVYCDAMYVGNRAGTMRARDWSVAALVTENYIHVSSLVKASVAREVGYYSQEMQDGFEDWDFYLKLAEKGFYGVYCKTTALRYRQHEEGARNDSANEKGKQIRQQIYDRHPGLYQQPMYGAALFTWKVRRRIRSWLTH